MNKAFKVIGKIGAGLLGLGGLILAGKTGFGESLKFGGAGEDELPPVMEPDDNIDVPECFETPEDITETTEEETSDE